MKLELSQRTISGFQQIGSQTQARAEAQAGEQDANGEDSLWCNTNIS